MRTKTLTFAMMAIAAGLYMTRGRIYRSVAGTDERGESFAAGAPEWTPRSSTADDALQGATGAPGVGAESPNPAEQLQESHAGDAFSGIEQPTASGAEAVDLFGSDSQRGAEAKAPGLPDFFRGA